VNPNRANHARAGRRVRSSTLADVPDRRHDIRGQVRSKVSIPFMMNTGRIFIANLSKGKLGADKANLLGSLLTMQFQFGAMSRVNQPGLLDAVAAKRIAALDAELAGLKAEAARLAVEVEELTPANNAGIV
jgi:hypothetical protein